MIHIDSKFWEWVETTSTQILSKNVKAAFATAKWSHICNKLRVWQLWVTFSVGVSFLVANAKKSFPACSFQNNLKKFSVFSVNTLL